MNMLDDEGDDFNPTYERHSHLILIECDAVELSSSTLGHEAFGAMLSALRLDGQHATIAKFIEKERDTLMRTLHHQQVYS